MEPTTIVSAEGDAQGVATDVVTAAVEAAVTSLQRRGYLQTENYVLVVGGLLSVGLAKIGVPGPEVTQIVAIAAPTIVAALLAYVRTSQKKALAALAASIKKL